MRTKRRLRPPPASRSSAAPKSEMHPSQFTMNQCWLIVKASDAPIRIDEGLFDVYVLQDAASMYLFGSVFTPSGSGNASEEEINSLLQGAWRTKHEWPKYLLLPDSIPSPSSFAVAAKRNRIPVEIVPESALAIYINDVQTAFREHFGGDETGAA
jgi:hypothetical protein